MKNPNSPLARFKKFLNKRWTAEDIPGSERRFQVTLFCKDVATFLILPLATVFLFKSCEIALSGGKRTQIQPRSVITGSNGEALRSQIIEFIPGGNSGTGSSVAKRSPGTLVRVRLLNVIETHGSAPVHVQILDAGLGKSFVGSTIIGDATPNQSIGRIEIAFRYVRDGRRESLAYPISARALNLDGTLGLMASKKEGFFARAALNSAGTAGQEAQGGSDGNDIKNIIARALTAGLMQEFGSEAQIERNRAQVLTLQPPSEFFVELTDFFPGAGK